MTTSGTPPRAPRPSRPASATRSGRTARTARGWTHEASPFHPGEQAFQRRIGVRDQVERAGRNMIREHMPDEHRQLFEALPLLVVGSVDQSGQVWASLLAGPPGFIHSPTSNLLQIEAQPAPGDPLADQLVIGAPLGLLGIQLETRRRNRANGHIIARDDRTFSVEVAQSFGNCPQYIQAREPEFDPARRAIPTPPPSPEGPLLSARATELLTRTDTLFIATASAHATDADAEVKAEAGAEAEGVDVSHRGGRPGFVRVTQVGQASRLTLPDFRGNFMFNTFGNLEVNPHAGIVCADFATGDILTLTGTARVVFDGPELEAFEGADRLLSFDVHAGRYLERALPLTFHGLVPSPYLLETGTWAETGLDAPRAPRTTG